MAAVQPTKSPIVPSRLGPMNSDELRRTKEIMQRVGERLMLAGWASASIDSEKSLGIRYTEKGSAGMDNLYHAIKDLNPDTLEEDHMIGLILHAILRHQAKQKTD